MKKRPNILLITIDCLRADHVSCLGYEKKTTPNIDKLAEEGVLFTQAIANGPSTYSSFPSIFTSTYPLMHASYPGLDETKPTLFEVLKKNNYVTAALYNNPYLSPRNNYDRGFTYYRVGSFSEEDKADSNESKVNVNNNEKSSSNIKEKTFGMVSKKGGAKDSSTSGGQKRYGLLSKVKRKARNIIRDYKAPFVLPYVTADNLAGEAVSWIENNRSKDFALWVHFMDTHCPFSPPREFLKTNIYEINRVWTIYRKNPDRVSEKDLKRIIRLYDGAIKFVDYSVGEIIGGLKKSGIYEDTLIVITSDHGDEFKEHGNFNHTRSLYEEVIRVPLVMKLPDSKEKVMVKEPVELLDLAPTILDISDIPLRGDFLGRSLLPAISNKDASGKGGGTAISELLIKNGKAKFGYDVGSYLISARTKKWKLIFNEEIGERELFDLEKDPNEFENVYQENKKTAAWLEQKIKEHMEMEVKARKTSKEKQKIKGKLKKLKI